MRVDGNLKFILSDQLGSTSVVTSDGGVEQSRTKVFGNDIISLIMSDLNVAGNPDCHGALHPKAIEGMELFNAGHYFEAHEALEAAWREETGPVRNLYRGILQVGVTYLHIQRRNYDGAFKVYLRSLKWLQLWPDTCRGVAVGQLRQDLETVMAALKGLGEQRIAEFDLSLLKPVFYSIGEIE